MKNVSIFTSFDIRVGQLGEFFIEGVYLVYPFLFAVIKLFM